MSLQTLNYPSHLFSKLSKQILHKTRMNPVLVVTPLPEWDNKPRSTKTFGLKSASVSNQTPTKGSLLCQLNAVGIIGGVSADASLYFARKLITRSNEGNEDINTIPFVLCSDPILNKSLLHHNNVSQLNEHTTIVESLRHKRLFLEKSGVRCIVMPCQISHSWYDEVSKGCSIPVLHMGECVAKELKEAKLKPFEAGSPLRIGVLATNDILNAGFYQDKLQKEGFEVVLPDKATMEHTIVPSIEAISRKDIVGAQNLLRIALQVLLVRAVNIVVLASDDMRALLPHDDPLLKKCVDPLDSLARSTIKFAQSASNGY
uniref:broad specificity amino-acid racemase RacX n=1 Tax=Erigeron canadensis TaxID=72917 RepID=UPI001CB9AA67|nr:broad specificity amino-acid racemase RacX [Erigeron canadensis]